MGNKSSSVKQSVSAVVILSLIGYSSYKIMKKNRNSDKNKKNSFLKLNFDEYKKEIDEINKLFSQIIGLNHINLKLISKYMLSIEILINKLLKEHIIESEKMFIEERRKYLDQLSQYSKIVKHHLNFMENQRVQVLQQILNLCSITEADHVYFSKLLFENNSDLMKTIGIINEREKLKSLVDESVYVSLKDAKEYIKTKIKKLELICDLEALKVLKQSHNADIFGIIMQNYIIDLSFKETGINEQNIFIRNEIMSDPEFAQLNQDYSRFCINKVFAH